MMVDWGKSGYYSAMKYFKAMYLSWTFQRQPKLNALHLIGTIQKKRDSLRQAQVTRYMFTEWFSKLLTHLMPYWDIEDLRNFHGVIFKLNSKTLRSKHWKFQIKKTRENLQKNQRNFHCVEFDKLNAMEITLNFCGDFHDFFDWRYIFTLEAVIFTGNYVKKVY